MRRRWEPANRRVGNHVVKQAFPVGNGGGTQIFGELGVLLSFAQRNFEVTADGGTAEDVGEIQYSLEYSFVMLIK